MGGRWASERYIARLALEWWAVRAGLAAMTPCLWAYDAPVIRTCRVKKNWDMIVLFCSLVGDSFRSHYYLNCDWCSVGLWNWRWFNFGEGGEETEEETENVRILRRLRSQAVAYRGVGGLGGFNRPPPKFRRPFKIMPNSTRLWKLS